MTLMVDQGLAHSEAVDNLFEKRVENIDVARRGLEAALEFHHVGDFLVLRDAAVLITAVDGILLAEFLVFEADIRGTQLLGDGRDGFVEVSRKRATTERRISFCSESCYIQRDAVAAGGPCLDG